MTIGDYASGLFDHWDIGSKTGGKGVLILFVEDLGTLKIEVSYELEDVFTDAFCKFFQPTIKNYYAGRYLGDTFGGVLKALLDYSSHCWYFTDEYKKARFGIETDY